MDRAKHIYTLPAKLAALSDVKSVTLVELTADEEIMAAKRARGDQVRLALELPKEAFRGMNGKPLSSSDGSVDKEWDRLHPVVRSCVMQAYNALHNPGQEDVTAFLQSRQTEV
jgi:hypothetical protein